MTRPLRRTFAIALGVLLVPGVIVSPARALYETAVVADGGVLTGRVRFVGAPPKLEPIPVAKNRETCGDTKESEALVIGPDGGVAGSVVLIEGVTRGKKPEGEFVIDNRGCVFVPHVSAVTAGLRVFVKNSDPIFHSTHGLLGATFAPNRTVFNVALPTAGQMIDISRRLGQFGPVRILCDTHAHMLAWVYVHDSPYIAVTDGRGAFRIEDVPSGRYRATMWHEPFRPRSVDRGRRHIYDEPQSFTKEVTIEAGATTTADFELR